MEKKPHDFLTGCIVIAVFIALSVYAGGVRALLYIGGALITGLLLLFLLKLASKRKPGKTDEPS